MKSLLRSVGLVWTMSWRASVIERPQHRDLLGLPRHRHPQVRPRLRPGAGEIGIRQRLALIAVEKNNVARFGLLFAQLQAQARTFHLFAFRLTALQRVPAPPYSGTFFSQGLGQLRTA